MAEVWRTRDRIGREVVLTSLRHDHILAEHDDLAPQMDDARLATEQPDFITRDARYPHRENHYRRTLWSQLLVKVVVNYRPVPPQGTWEGEVITAYRARRPKSKEAQLWP